MWLRFVSWYRYSDFQQKFSLFWMILFFELARTHFQYAVRLTQIFLFLRHYRTRAYACDFFSLRFTYSGLLLPSRLQETWSVQSNAIVVATLGACDFCDSFCCNLQFVWFLPQHHYCMRSHHFE